MYQSKFFYICFSTFKILHKRVCIYIYEKLHIQEQGRNYLNWKEKNQYQK